jgi:hypothetical protein
MSNHTDAGVELLADLVKERLQELRRELQQKVELAIKMAACSLSEELMVAESHHNQNGHEINESAANR